MEKYIYTREDNKRPFCLTDPTPVAPATALLVSRPTSLPDAPMCGCIEDMPEVSRADCSMHRPSREGRFKACKDNDLRTQYEIVYPDAPLANLVDQCDNA